MLQHSEVMNSLPKMALHINNKQAGSLPFEEIIHLHPNGEVSEKYTLKYGLKHGVHYQFQPKIKNTMNDHQKCDYFWEGEEAFRPVYWVQKNWDEIKTGNPFRIIKALFKSNDMTQEDFSETSPQPQAPQSSRPNTQRALTLHPFSR